MNEYAAIPPEADEKETERRRDIERLLWLAETQREYGVASSTPPTRFERLLKSQPDWIKPLFFADFPLRDEPRCLAVSPDGKAVAVGTKAGAVHLIRWVEAEADAQEGYWHPTVFPKVADTAPEEGELELAEIPPEAIRAIGFADPETLVAGTFAGTFLVAEGIHHARKEPAVRAIDPLIHAEERGPGWLRRFTRLVVVSHPDRPRSTGPLALGLTESLRVHLLTRESSGYTVRSGELTDFLTAHGSASWPASTRLVDGAWQEDRLWLLGSDRKIYRYVWEDSQDREPSRLPLRLEAVKVPDRGQQWSVELSYPHASCEPRRLVACPKGLALLISNHVTFLPFHHHEQASYKKTPFVKPENARWVAIPQAADLAVWPSLPDVLPRNSSGLLEDYRSNEITQDLVWTVAGSTEPGLHWISWSTTSSGAPMRLGGQESPPNLAGVGRHSVLAIGFGRWRGRGPFFLASATRDHHLLLTSLTVQSQARVLLDERLPEFLRPVGDQAGDRHPWELLEATHRTPGVALWLLGIRMRYDLGHRPGVQLPSEWQHAETRPLLETLEEADLRSLADVLLGTLQSSDMNIEDRSLHFKGWVLGLLRRASQLESQTLSRIARILHEGIAGGHARDESTEIWQHLGPFAGFLRKWIVHGKAYANLPTGLLDRWRWNRRCNYHLDALVYLAKLIRRRYDSIWEVRGTPVDSGSPTWDLVADGTGEFSIQSYTDGTLTALTRDGEAIRWQPLVPNLKDLCLTHRNRCLTRILAEDYFEQYHHGPYARRLLLHEVSLEGEKHFLLLLCFRGWHPESEAPNKSPLLCVLLLRFRREKVNSVLEIVSLDTKCVKHEIYGFCHLAAETGATRSDLFIAGTRDTLGHETPFLEVPVELDRDKVVRFQNSDSTNREIDFKPVVQTVKYRKRSSQREHFLRKETGHNPCWSLAPVAFGDDIWLCAGFADGKIRYYKREENTEENGRGKYRWVEGGTTRKKSEFGELEEPQPTDRSLSTTSQVWNLVYIKDVGLAYGTADGVVGLVDLKPHLYNSADRPWIHLLHTREMAPICRLIPLRDIDDGRLRLLAISQDGYAAIYHIQEAPPPHSGRFAFTGGLQDRFPFGHKARAAALVNETNESHKSRLKCDLPTLLIGTDEGKVHKHVLVFPRNSKRRKVAAKDCATSHLIWELSLGLSRPEERPPDKPIPSGTTPTLAQCVGQNEKTQYEWLSVLDIGGPEMIRYSFWRQLAQAWSAFEVRYMPKEGIPEDPVEAAEFLRLMKGLSHEAFLRQPNGRDPAKIIWEMASKAANSLAAKAIAIHDVARPKAIEYAEKLIAVYNEINEKVDDLCNRWIGVEHAIESRVLIHSFNTLFDWPDVILIAWRDAPLNVDISRRFLIYDAIHRRLNYNDSAVRLETLRVLNVAMRRAIVNHNTDSILHEKIKFDLVPAWSFNRSDPEIRPVGFYDLVELVGELAERYHESLPAADPLTTEIICFFSLSLLLVPHCSLVIGQTISESLLMEHDSSLPRMILDHAEMLRELYGLDSSGRSFQRFKAYCKPGTRFRPSDRKRGQGDASSLTAPGSSDLEWWPLMTEISAEEKDESDRPGDHWKMRDIDVLREQRHALYAAEWMASLEPIGPKERKDVGPWTDAQSWLEDQQQPHDISTTPKYMSHTHKYLQKLRVAQKAILEAFSKDDASLTADRDDNSSAPEISLAELSLLDKDGSLPNPQETPLEKAKRICELMLENLKTEDLFEPQRSHYRQVMLAWRERIERRAQEAVEVLDAIDSFNRHVYRTSADDLLAEIAEQAMQIAPLQVQERNNLSLSHRIEEALDGHPLTLRIFRDGTLLVDHTHLAGTLLAVARNSLRDPGRRKSQQLRLKYEIRLTDIYTLFKRIADRFGLVCNEVDLKALGDKKALGTRAIWHTMIYECANNVRRHPSREKKEREMRCDFIHEAPRRALLLSGTVAFRECLKPSYIEQLERIRERAGESGEAQALWALAQQALESGRRLSAVSSPGGIGMSMIKKICEFFGLQAKVWLFQVGEMKELRFEPSNKDILTWPLCLEISWPVKEKRRAYESGR